MPIASLEEMESNDIIVSIYGDRVSDLVREGNITIVQRSMVYVLTMSCLF